jgi:SAM-dependent methyltransferase
MAEYLQISDSQIPVADASFDIVFTACVFHHIDHSGHTHWLAEIKRVLVPGGVFGLFEHNPWNPLTRRAVNTCPFDENARLISMPNMRTRLREAGFNVLRSRFTFFFPSFLRGLRALETRMGWLPLGGQYFLLAQK